MVAHLRKDPHSSLGVQTDLHSLADSLAGMLSHTPCLAQLLTAPPRRGGLRGGARLASTTPSARNRRHRTVRATGKVLKGK